jgi:hypothetical protein
MDALYEYKQVEASGSKWKQVEASESKWKQVEASGSKWKQVEASGSKWKQVEASGSKWKHREANRNKQKQIETSRNKQKHAEAPCFNKGTYRGMVAIKHDDSTVVDVSLDFQTKQFCQITFGVVLVVVHQDICQALQWKLHRFRPF